MGIVAGQCAFLDQHMTYEAMVYRQDRSGNGDDFADGEYNATGRLTFLPIYENDGRCLLHLGVFTAYLTASRILLGAHLVGIPGSPVPSAVAVVAFVTGAVVGDARVNGRRTVCSAAENSCSAANWGFPTVGRGR